MFVASSNSFTIRSSHRISHSSCCWTFIDIHSRNKLPHTIWSHKMEFHEHFHYSQTKTASNLDRYLKFYIQFNSGVQFGQFYNQRPSKMRWNKLVIGGSNFTFDLKSRYTQITHIHTFHTRRFRLCSGEWDDILSSQLSPITNSLTTHE